MREGKLGVTPLEPSQIQPASIDLTLGDTLLFPIPNDYWMVPKGKIPFVNFEKPIEYEKVVRKEALYIPSQTFCLATTQETLELAEEICASVHGRSSVGRGALMIECAGWVDPGFKGTITLELFNMNKEPIMIPVGTRICQAVFEWCGACERPYGHEELDSKYQGQKGTTGTRIYQDKVIK